MKCENCIHYDICGINTKAVCKANNYKLFKDKNLTVELPCKVGDKVYVIPSETNYRLNILHKHNTDNRIYEQIVNEISFFENNVYLLCTCDGLQCCHSDFYKIDWFLTKKEAEKALNDLKERAEEKLKKCSPVNCKKFRRVKK